MSDLLAELKGFPNFSCFRCCFFYCNIYGFVKFSGRWKHFCRFRLCSDLPFDLTVCSLTAFYWSTIKLYIHIQQSNRLFCLQSVCFLNCHHFFMPLWHIVAEGFQFSNSQSALTFWCFDKLLNCPSRPNSVAESQLLHKAEPVVRVWKNRPEHYQGEKKK